MNSPFSFLEEMRKLRDELEAHPRVKLLHYREGKPAHPLYFRKAECFVEKALPPALRAMYETADGVQLAWIHDSHPEFENAAPWETDEPLEAMVPLKDRPVSGFIFLLSIGLVFEFLSGAWMEYLYPYDRTEGEMLVDGKTYDEYGLRRTIRPFDQFDDYYNMAYIQMADKGPISYLHMGMQHHYVYNQSKVIDFDTYLHFILKTKGLSSARRQAFYKPNPSAFSVFTQEDLLTFPETNLDLDLHHEA